MNISDLLIISELYSYLFDKYCMLYIDFTIYVKRIKTGCQFDFKYVYF